jgi:hypothetical protein
VNKTVGEHIRSLESRREQLHEESMKNRLSLSRRNQIESDIRAINLAISYYRAAVDTEKQLNQWSRSGDLPRVWMRLSVHVQHRAAQSSSGQRDLLSVRMRLAMVHQATSDASGGFMIPSLVQPRHRIHHGFNFVVKEYPAFAEEMTARGYVAIAGLIPLSVPGELRAVTIFRVGPEQTATLLKDDPSVREGLLKPEIHPWATGAGVLASGEPMQ